MTAVLRSGEAAQHLPQPPRRQTRTGHHPSHGTLVHRPLIPSAGDKRVDAIVVPTARRAARLGTAIALAVSLDCPLLALCSKYAKAEDVLVEAGGVNNVIAVNVPDSVNLPEFTTSSMLAGTRFERHADTSVKRNVGLVVAKRVGWQRIIFLDDDIEVHDAKHLRAAASLLKSYNMVGLENNGFPDNSVVCHAYRAVGGRQDTFIGGGAMAVLVDRASSFFPKIYNEDWFFLLDDAGITPVAVAGKVTQKEFDPYANPQRARSEELGDCLAEGVYALLDDEKWVHHGDRAYWTSFLQDRQRLIDMVVATIPGADAHRPDERDRMRAALLAARGRLAWITPEICTDYLAAWRNDRAIWQKYLKSLSSCRSVDAALAGLGLTRAKVQSSALNGRSGPNPPRPQAPLWTIDTPLSIAARSDLAARWLEQVRAARSRHPAEA